MPTRFKTANIARAAGILALLFSFSAQSEGDCYAVWQHPPSLPESSITVPAGAKVGDLIGQSEANFSVRLLANAIQFSFGEPGDLVLQAFTYLTATALTYNGIPVYQTPWQGVGLAMSLNGQPGLWDIYAPRSTPVGYVLGGNAKYYLVKTGDIASGVMPPFTPFLFNYTCLRATNARRLGETNFPPINIAVEGCRLSTPSKQVFLGKINRRTLSGIGSVSGNTPFSIAMECNANTKVDLEIRGEMANGNRQVLAATPSKDAATGVGLQILRNGIPFELGSKADMLNQTLVGINEIPLSVQYYQTRENVTPGEVNAVAQFTVSYR